MQRARLLTTSAVCAALAAAAPAQAQGIDMYLGQVFTGGWSFCPVGSAPASGQIVSIQSNSALFALFGTAFGGDGVTTFGMPDLQGRSPMGTGNGAGLSPKVIGQKGGVESFTLTIANMPIHTHTGLVRAENTVVADSGNPQGNTIARAATNIYSDNSPPSATAALNAGTLQIDPAGGGQPVTAQSPYQVLTFCVATSGIFPSRN